MMQKAQIFQQENVFFVTGELIFSTVMHMWKTSLPLLNKANELHFDLSKVNSCNSAGVALILEWMTYAKKNNKSIEFHNIPSQLMSIVAVSGLQSILNPVLT